MPRWALAFRLLGLGWYIAFCILGGVAGGYWLDQRLGLQPLFLLIGVVTGSAVAFYGMFRMVSPLLAPDDSHGSAETTNTLDEERPQ